MLNLTKEFERLVIDYSHLGACWNLGCTTCGCMHIRSAFRHLDDLPGELDIRNKPKWEWDRDLCPNDEFVIAAAECDMENLHEKAKFNDWLGILGVCMLEASQSAAYPSLVKNWGESFSKLNTPLFTSQLKMNNSTFTWRDLSLVEKDLMNSRFEQMQTSIQEERAKDIAEARAAYRKAKSEENY